MNRKKKSSFVSICVFVCMAFFCTVVAEEAKQTGNEEMLKQIDVFIRTLQIIRKQYVDAEKIDTGTLFVGAMQGMASKLDPYSTFIPAKDVKPFLEGTEGLFGGVGITVGVNEKGDIYVVSTVPDGPAEKAGVKAGDIFSAINGVALTEEDKADISKKLRGQPDTSVKLTVIRPSEENHEIEFEIIRKIIEVPTVVGGKVIEGTNIGYVRLLQFMQPSAKHLEKVLRKFEEQKVDSVILDLRGNPGGLLETAVDICGMFLPANSLVVTIRYHSDKFENRKSENFHQYFTKKNGYTVSDKVKLMILVNQESASASEITAGCLRDYGRAVLVGARTFGKGSVQNLIDVGNGHAIKMTIARYYTPDENRPIIDKNGVMPDIKVPMAPDSAISGEKIDLDNDVQLARAVEILKSLPVLVMGSQKK